MTTTQKVTNRINSFTLNMQDQFAVVSDIAKAYHKIQELEKLPACSMFGTEYQGQALIKVQLGNIERFEEELHKLRVEALSL